ncbi:AgmX/PglI C-terminal domain-containing protein [Polyangium mundeleinium]|uniref:AgmX/PglI C-terminal domain-containing protein n=1 Tax=Polyangium mundeleinium TaxID=2995306 RepID=A0ABT5ESY8_9BACT|nr:AgmX/PglI C-terminal domain-containing protein [Polyangium mundeleinium]MDC0743846.1 AgmX/PglI C-terminal domain-containing protein [Polyangium mundeleinium]
MMKQFGRGFALVSLASTFVLGCAGEGTEGTEAPAIQAAPAGETSVALRIERVARALDRGEDPKQALDEIVLALTHPAATATEQDEATLVQSRALEANGDMEGAISAVEALLAQHAGDREWAFSSEAEKRLRKLLTGSEDTPKRRLTPAEPPVSIFAAELAKYFPADAGGRYRVRVLAFGGDRNFSSDRIGTFNVGGAIRAEKEKTCPTCEVNVDSNTNRETSWIGIVRARAELASSLVVYYYDLEGGEIPARYDAELPLPSAEIKARLAKGKGLVAAKKRDGAPPVILIAAPRFSQLDNVESTLAGMDALPLEATSVDVPASLEAEEIQAVVRGSFNSFRVCYETVLQRNPAAQGSISLDFKIDADGHVTTMKATADSASIQSMETCMRDAAQALVFPAATKETWVVYPVLFTP